MMNRQLKILGRTAAILLLSTQVFAHHGIKNYRTDRLTSLKGTVTEYEFQNPHVLIEMEVEEVAGNRETWTIEVAPPSMLYKVGWNKNTLKPNDTIEVTGYPAKDGSRLLSVRRIVLPNGQDLNQNSK